jgi:hypothetical protein
LTGKAYDRDTETGTAGTTAMGLKYLIDTEAGRRAEYGRRKKYHGEKTIHPKLREEHEGEGWILVKDLQSGAKMRKAKSHDEPT